MSIDKEFAFQEAMVGSAIGSIAQLNERNLRLVNAFLDNQLKLTEEEKAESQDSPFIIIETHKIEKGIPLPTKRGKNHATATHMEIGDSVLMGTIGKAVGLANAMRLLNKQPAMRRQSDGQVRVWYREDIKEETEESQDSSFLLWKLTKQKKLS